MPTLAEAGYPELTSFDWVGFSVRAGTPLEDIARLNGAANKVLKDPKVAEAFEKVGSATAGSTPAQLGDLIKSQVALWAKVIDEAGLKAQQ